MTASTLEAPAPVAGHSPRFRGGAGAWIAGLAIAGFLALFLLVPVGSVIYTAFVTEEGHITFGHFSNFLAQSLLRESLANSMTVALLSVVFASLIAIPLAYLTVRFEFRGAVAIQTLGVL